MSFPVADTPETAPAFATRRVIRIRAARGSRAFDLAELWEYRDLIYFLVWRDSKVRYKQTVLGVAWAILQPLSTMLVFSLFFGRLARIPSDGVPYPLFTYAALVPWAFFSNAMIQAANSVVLNQQLITRVYFPRVIIPLSTVLSGAVDFAITFVVLLGLLMVYDLWPTLRMLWVVPLSVLALLTATGVGVWLAALNVRYRDIRYIVPFLTQFWLFATPIAYPSSLLSEPWRTLYAVNPMVGVVEGFRWAVLRTPIRPDTAVLIATVVSIALFLAGVRYFHSVERTFADVV